MDSCGILLRATAEWLEPDDYSCGGLRIEGLGKRLISNDVKRSTMK